jgi:hypothetical protein
MSDANSSGKREIDKSTFDIVGGEIAGPDRDLGTRGLSPQSELKTEECGRTEARVAKLKDPVVRKPDAPSAKLLQ